jgi:large subunit ribosomal protein L6
MSRIGKVPVEIPDGVDLSIDGRDVTVKGKGGELTRVMPELVSLSQDDRGFVVDRDDDSKPARSAQGLARTLVANMVEGVTNGFERKLMIEGVGFRAEPKGKRWIQFTLGYSHPILYKIPDGLEASIDAKENSLTLKGADKQLLGATSAEIRALRPPEPYKGKGVRYADERIRRKEGKTGAK